MSPTDYLAAPGLTLLDCPVAAIDYERPRDALSQEAADRLGVLCRVRLADGRTMAAHSSSLKVVARVPNPVADEILACDSAQARAYRTRSDAALADHESDIPTGVLVAGTMLAIAAAAVAATSPTVATALVLGLFRLTL